MGVSIQRPRRTPGASLALAARPAGRQSLGPSPPGEFTGERFWSRDLASNLLPSICSFPATGRIRKRSVSSKEKRFSLLRLAEGDDEVLVRRPGMRPIVGRFGCCASRPRIRPGLSAWWEPVRPVHGCEGAAASSHKDAQLEVLSISWDRIEMAMGVPVFPVAFRTESGRESAETVFLGQALDSQAGTQRGRSKLGNGLTQNLNEEEFRSLKGKPLLLKCKIKAKMLKEKRLYVGRPY